jgi:phosphoribosylformimino-5-aminoimidazole carboxamide ribotide isomerase
VIAIPAIDVREGSCVQVIDGSYTMERMRSGDPAAVAREWEYLGFARLHLVDLDAATQRGSNAAQIREILGEGSMDVQVGGGMCNTEQVGVVLAEGARYAIVGNRALEDLEWLAEVAHEHPGEIILAADVRERRIVTPGWQRNLPRNILDVLDELNDVPLAALLVTAVHKAGQLLGVDLPLMEDVVDAAPFPVFAAGGVGGMGDLWALADRGIAGAVIGMALYTGALDPRAVADEFAQ